MKDLSDLDPAMRLAMSVIKRCSEGEGVEVAQKELKHYDATLHRCHDNVKEFVAMHPECSHVFGFFVAPRILYGSLLVIPHSVVGTPDGALNDITPSETEYRYPFVRHIGTQDEFALIAASEPFTLEVPAQLVRQYLGIVPSFKLP
jgi:hypothetical protein